MFYRSKSCVWAYGFELPLYTSAPFDECPSNAKFAEVARRVRLLNSGMACPCDFHADDR